MKKISKILMLSAVAVAVTACGNLSNVTKEGTTDNPVFPDISSAKFNHDGSQMGSWPNWDNVRQIEKGMNKDQLYNLIGRPHFAEGLYDVREWDYVFNYRERGVHKVCQYKVLFDKNMNVNQQWWLPNGCNGFARFDLNADFLFAFDKDTLSAKGHEVVTQLANEVKALGVSAIEVQGHTDRLGTDVYNMDLSQRRANTIKSELLKQGVTAPITAIGYGETQQVKECVHDGASAAEKACLQPNRRVTVLTEGGLREMETAPEKVAGHDGPTKVKIYQNDAKKTSWQK